MRNISASLTKKQFRSRSKHVTRRLGWKNARPGELLQVCEKCQGLKPGEHLVKICVIRVSNVRREKLSRMSNEPTYGAREARLEGFPSMDGSAFVRFFCKEMECDPETEITRIEFEYVD
jgi:hypothetical protein